MTPKVRKVLMWGGAFLLAFAGGSVLGGFTVSGLAGDDRSLPNSSDVQNFWAAQDRARTNGSDAPDVAAMIAHQPPGNHVCDGCDAGETRGRLRLGNLAGSYSDEAGENEQPSASPPDSAPAPAASAAGH
jgi:hypothetical protein